MLHTRVLVTVLLCRGVCVKFIIVVIVIIIVVVIIQSFLAELIIIIANFLVLTANN